MRLRTIALFYVAVATTTGRAQDSAAHKHTEPTLAETVTWLKTDGALLMVSSHQSFRGCKSDLEARHTSEVDVRDCHLVWLSTDSTIDYRAGVFGPLKIFSASRYDVPLKDLDVGGVATSVYGTDSTVTVRVPMRAAAGKGIRAAWVDRSARRSKSDSTLNMQEAATLPVESVQAGERIANAIKRAAVLCGAPAAPF